MVQFLGAWLLEGPDITALRIHARHYVADHAILARRVHALQNEHYGPFILSPQLLLQHAQELRAAFQKIVRSFLGMNVADVGGIPIVETKLLVFGDAVRFGDAESFFGEFVGFHGVARSVVRKCGDEEGLEHRQTKKRPWEGNKPPRAFSLGYRSQPLDGAWCASASCYSSSRSPRPNRSFMVLVLASQAWFKHGSPSPPSMVRSSEKWV